MHACCYPRGKSGTRQRLWITVRPCRNNCGVATSIVLWLLSCGNYAWKYSYLRSLSFFCTEIAQCYSIHILWDTRNYLACVVNTMTVHDLVTQGARSLTVMVVAMLYWNVPGSALEGFMLFKFNSVSFTKRFVFDVMHSYDQIKPPRYRCFNYHSWFLEPFNKSRPGYREVFKRSSVSTSYHQLLRTESQ